MFAFALRSLCLYQIRAWEQPGLWLLHGLGVTLWGDVLSGPHCARVDTPRMLPMAGSLN